MPIENRTVSMTSIFAENAQTNIPANPVPGISYRDTNTTPEEISTGWPYKEIVDSSSFNQYNYELSTLIKLIETYGFLPWSNLTNYEVGSVALGSDGSLYKALRDTGPDTTSFNPVNDTNHTYWENWIEAMQYGIGDIKQSVRSSNHGNWILCNGQAISRTSYIKLFEIIGTQFGSGDGSNTFNVPDYRGKFLRGLGGNSASNIYTTQSEGLPNITGTLTSITHIGSGGATGAMSAENKGGNGMGGSGGRGKNLDVTFNASKSNSIYGKSSHVTPVNMAVNFFIRAK